MQYLGIPVGIGLGKIKVLAKVAHYLAKKYNFLNGVCNLEELGANMVNKAFSLTYVSEVFGIGVNYLGN